MTANKVTGSSTGVIGTKLPPVICVASNDGVWANLLAQNLAARGASTIQCDVHGLRRQVSSIADGSWIVIDGGWPLVELQSAIEELKAVLDSPRVNSVMVVDKLIGLHQLESFKPDMTINRTPDMRVLVRDLLSVFQSHAESQAEQVASK